MQEHSPAPTASRAVYGFALYLTFKLGFILFMLWALIPPEYFAAIGITYLPNRYWAIAIPIFSLTVLTLFVFVIYPCLGFCMTPDLDSLQTIQDHFTQDQQHLLNNTDEDQNLTTTGVSNNSEMVQCCCLNPLKCYKIEYEKLRKSQPAKPIPALKDLNMWEVTKQLYSN